MDIGRTNKRITFCRYEEKENALSQLEQALVEVKTVWASVEPTRGREYQEAQRIRPELTYKITTRYHKGIAPDMFIKFKDRFFNIVSIINVKERNEVLEIICTESLLERHQKTMKESERQVFGDQKDKNSFQCKGKGGII